MICILAKEMENASDTWQLKIAALTQVFVLLVHWFAPRHNQKEASATHSNLHINSLLVFYRMAKE